MVRFDFSYCMRVECPIFTTIELLRVCRVAWTTLGDRFRKLLPRAPPASLLTPALRIESLRLPIRAAFAAAAAGAGAFGFWIPSSPGATLSGELAPHPMAAAWPDRQFWKGS